MAEYVSYNSVQYSVPFQVSHNFKTLVSQFNSQGVEKRKKKWLFPKRDITLNYSNNLSYIEARTIWQFYLNMYGAYEAFSFFFVNSDTYENEYISTGNGSDTVYDLPGKSTSARTVYVDGSTMTPGGSAYDYTFNADDGADGSDSITFNIAPAAGARITIDFAGLLRVRCRFAEDSLQYEQMYLRLTNIGLSLKGLLNDE